MNINKNPLDNLTNTNKPTPHSPPLPNNKNQKVRLEKRLGKVQKSMKKSNKKVRKVIFRHSLSPGDLVMMTAAVRDMKLSHPDIQIDVRTPAAELWENNPHLTKLEENDPDVKIYKIEYPIVHNSNEGQYHFIHGFRKDIQNKLNIRIKSTIFKGDIHISDEEKSWMSQIEEMGIKEDFWIINSGIKYDFTAKAWNPSYYQKVVNHFRGKITFVQIGEKDHWHPPLKGVINLVGKTDLRQLIRLIYHSIGVVCPVTLVMHLAAAIEMKKTPPLNRACVVIAGGREPSIWEKYCNHRYLDANGCLDCCDRGGCWKSRCQKVGDGDEKDRKDLCVYPVQTNYDFKEEKLVIPKCLDIIKPSDVIRAIEMYYKGGVLKYNS